MKANPSAALVLSDVVEEYLTSWGSEFVIHWHHTLGGAWFSESTVLDEPSWLGKGCGSVVKLSVLLVLDSFQDTTVLSSRSPSPEPIYNNEGKRLNTREYRTRKKLEDERHHLVQEAWRHNPNYKPPADYK